MKFPNSEHEVALKPHLEVLLEDDVGFGSMIADMYKGGLMARVHRSPSFTDSDEGFFVNESTEDIVRGHPDGYSGYDGYFNQNSTDMMGYELTGPQRMPKSKSMPLQDVPPDPFPELSCNPFIDSVAVQTAKVGTRSSPGSPMERRSLGGTCSPSGTLKHLKKPARRRHSAQETVSDVTYASTYARRPRFSTGPQQRMNVWSSSNPIMKPSSIVHTMLNFYNDEGTHTSVSIDDKMQVSDATCLLILRNHVTEDRHWSIIEHVSKFNLERSLEDHELLLHVYRSWGHAEENRFCFRKDYRKHEVFQTTPFFPCHMIDMKDARREAKGLDKVDRASSEQGTSFLQAIIDGGELAPDINGYMHLREGKKSWKKHFFVLRKSGLYYSSKGNSKEPRHLTLLSPLTDVNIYTGTQAKKTLGAPNNFCIVLKSTYCVTDVRELRCLCAEDEQARTCWLTALRLVKYGSKLLENHTALEWREDRLENLKNLNSSTSDSYSKSRVPMDFTSGVTGRVVTDPSEAIGIVLEEGTRLRRQIVRPFRSSSPSCPSPPRSWAGDSGSPRASGSPRHPGLSLSIHLTQPWYHGNISREDAVDLIMEQGVVNGVFLVRESNSMPGSYVLSLAHNHRVKHCQIHKIESDGQWFLSLDGGHTKFSDLLQLVDFYQLNASGLPTKLTHYITRLL